MLYRNFPDFDSPKISYKPSENNKIKLVYAGLLGVAQGVFKLCQELDFSKIELHIYGSGAEQKQIESFIKSHPQLPLYFHGRVSRQELHGVLLQYDIAIIPLLNRIYGSVPSKIFEYAKLGLPILYFGGGEGEDLISQYQLGWIANAGDYTHLNQIIASLEKKSVTLALKENIKATAQKNFSLKKQLDELMTLL